MRGPYRKLRESGILPTRRAPVSTNRADPSGVGASMQRTQADVQRGDGPSGTSWTFGTSWSFTGLPGRVLALVAAVVVASGLAAAPAPQQQAAVDATQAVVAGAEEVVQVIV